MKKLGIILIVIGLMQAVAITYSLVNKDGASVGLIIIPVCVLILGCSLFFLGRYKKKQAIEKGLNYKEIGWGKVIMWVFILMIGLGAIGRIFSSVSENSFVSQVKRANEDCPIPIAGGTVNITSIKAIDKQVVYTLEFDSNYYSYHSLDWLSSSPTEYKRMFVLSSSLLNGQNGNSDKFFKLVLENGYGIKFILVSTNGKKNEISLTDRELRSLWNEVKDSPAEAMKELLELQIKDAGISLPMKLEDDLTLTDIFCDSDNLIYRMVVEEPLSISEIANANTEEFRTEILTEMYSDPGSMSNMDMCAVGKFNIIYRYVTSDNTDSCNIVFTHKEIRDITQLPRSLKFK